MPSSKTKGHKTKNKKHYKYDTDSEEDELSLSKLEQVKVLVIKQGQQIEKMLTENVSFLQALQQKDKDFEDLRMQINNMQIQIESLDSTCNLKTACHLKKFTTDKMSIGMPYKANTAVCTSTTSNNQLPILPILAKHAMKLPCFRFGSDIELYVKRIEMYIEHVGIASEHQCNTLMSGLDDVSLNAVLKQSKFADWTDFQTLKTFLIKRFKHFDFGQTAKFSFRVCKQKEETNIDDYVTELFELALIAFPNASNDLIDQAILEQFLNGICDAEIQMKLIEKSPATIEEAINYYKHLQNVNKYRQLLEANSSQLKSNISTSNIAANKIFKIASISKTNNSNFTHKVISCRPICFNCHRPGHFSRSCRQKGVDNHWFSRARPQFEHRQLDNWRQKRASQNERDKLCSTECQTRYLNCENHINKSTNHEKASTNSNYPSSHAAGSHYREGEEQKTYDERNSKRQHRMYQYHSESEDDSDYWGKNCRKTNLKYNKRQ